MVTSDEIPSEIVEGITKHLYREYKIYQLIVVYENGNIPTKYNHTFIWSLPLCYNKCVTLKFRSSNELDGWLFAFNNADPYLRYHVSKSVITHKRGGIDMLNLRAVCKAFGRQSLQQIIGKYDLQFQRGLYSYILTENLRFNENWVIFPDHKDHPHYRRAKTWRGIFIYDNYNYSYDMDLQNRYLTPDIITYRPWHGIWGNAATLRSLNRKAIKTMEQQYNGPIIGNYPATLNPVFKKIDNVIANLRPRNRTINNNRSRNTYNNRKIVNNLPVKRIKNNANFIPSSGSRKGWHR